MFPHVTQHALLSANISRTFTQHIKGAFWDKRGGGTGSTKQKKKTLKNSLTVYEKTILDYFRSINCTNVSFHGCNCCKTGIEVSKCVYLACMAVKIEHTVDGHNHDILQQCISDAKYGASTRVKLAKYMLLSIKTYLHARKIT